MIKIKLFGEDFIKNNKDNCYLIINNKKQELTEYIEIKEQQKLEIKLYETKNITNMSGMFYNCSSLSSLPDISKWELNEKLNTYEMFEGVDKNIIPEKFKDC